MNTKHTTFDVIIVGGGHAGIEAAYAAAKMGSRTLMITLDTSKIGLMPCNPAIGGIGKGHIVFEVSAFGGLMPQLCTRTYLQARMLNTRKGPAVQGLRLQIDKIKYKEAAQKALKKVENLTIHAARVDLLLQNKDGSIEGVVTDDGISWHAPTVVITTGTFLNGTIHVGTENYKAGRVGEGAVTELAQWFYAQNLEMGRLKTGTPPRLKKSTLDFSKMERQSSDPLTSLFEFDSHNAVTTHDCFITRTNEQTHQVIKDNMHLSPMYTDQITGTAPRYCPSIEDKVARFPQKTSHQIFVEPESALCDEVYPNGISTSLPLEAQEKYIRSIKGFENAEIVRPGYAVEYDFILPHQLHHSLELKKIPGLFLAGQINGTTGYEEAAGQGLVAGINAHNKAHGKESFVLNRTESYIGVMIDDLVTLSVDEPYRMFTSRAERRLLLRQDNVFERLGKKAHQLGLISDELFTKIREEQERVAATLRDLKQTYKHTELLQLFANPETYRKELKKIYPDLSERAIQTIHATILYEPYLEREQRDARRTKQYQTLKIPTDMRFSGVSGLSTELQQKLEKVRPATIAQAALIPGITPAALSLLIFKIQQKSS